MNQSHRRVFFIAGFAAIALAQVVGLYLVLDGETVAGDVGGEPLDDARKAQFQGTYLDFIAETGRIVVNDNGFGQIIWDPPQLPTLEESIHMAAEAKAANDMGLLPLCTEEYMQYLKEQKGPEEPEDDRVKYSPPPSFPACNAIPDGIYFGPQVDRHDISIGSPNFRAGTRGVRMPTNF